MPLVKILSDTSIKRKHVTKDSIVDVDDNTYSELFHASRAVLAPGGAKIHEAPARDFAKEEVEARAAFRSPAAAKNQ